MKLISAILTLTVLASTVASAAVKLSNREALEKAPRWVTYITYDDVSDNSVETAPEKARRWVTYITYDDVEEPETPTDS